MCSQYANWNQYSSNLFFFSFYSLFLSISYNMFIFENENMDYITDDTDHKEVLNLIRKNNVDFFPDNSTYDTFRQKLNLRRK